MKKGAFKFFVASAAGGIAGYLAGSLVKANPLLAIAINIGTSALVGAYVYEEVL